MKVFRGHFLKSQLILVITAVILGVCCPKIWEQLRSIHFGKKDTANGNLSAGNYNDLLFSKEQLNEFNGVDGQPIYLALLGRVYDVTRDEKHYGSGWSYHFFAGRDASVAFVTADFKNYIEEEADNVLALKSPAILSLINWERFFKSKYIYKGKVIGRFYNESGHPTKYENKFRAMAEEAEFDSFNKQKLRDKYPDCNIEWSMGRGFHVWCTESSGGKERNWIGYPRKLYGLDNADIRCACVKNENLDTNEVVIKPYDNCDSKSQECYYPVN
uniref:Cytochrome b5 heme-binding domain-containing protein n=1 Tax=Glossina pallidipes TaxID=7398 RepID=A0A1A9ZQ67_GLOPL